MIRAALKPGDRVELVGKLALYHGVAHGTVHAIHDGHEDTVELLLDNGVYTCTDPPKIRRA